MREKVEAGAITLDDFHNIMQGHRNKKSKDIYMKLRKLMIDNKDFLNPKHKGQEQIWANNLANMFFSFASNRPKSFGVY